MQPMASTTSPNTPAARSDAGGDCASPRGIARFHRRAGCAGAFDSRRIRCFGRERFVRVAQHGGVLLRAYQSEYIFGWDAFLRSTSNSSAVGQGRDALVFAHLRQTRRAKTQGLGSTFSRANPQHRYGGYGGKEGKNEKKPHAIKGVSARYLFGLV